MGSLFSKLNNAVKTVMGADSSNSQDQEALKVSSSGAETDSLNYKVAGVTFNNDDGESRQTIISKLKTGDKLIFQITTFDNENAIAIFNEKKKQVGFVKKGNIGKTLKHIDKGGLAVVVKAQKSIDTDKYYLIYKLV